MVNLNTDGSMKRKYKLIPIDTIVEIKYNWGQVIRGKVIKAYHSSGRIRYEVLDDKDGRSVWEGNSRNVKPLEM